MGTSVVHHILLLLLGFIHTGGALPSVKAHVVHVLFPLLLFLLFSGFPLSLELLLDEKLLLLFSLFVLRTKAVPTRKTHELILELPLLLIALLLCSRSLQSSNPVLFLILNELEFLFLEDLLADVSSLLPFLVACSSLLFVDFGGVSVDVLEFEVQVCDS